ncbi:MAG: radical SAM protein [Desulfobacca sp.]|nr:radical SAM protein [Desulfobacca sp.]
MRSLICRRHCQFFKPAADEPEKCLGYEFLAAWVRLEPGLAAALDQLPPGSAPETEQLAQVSKLLCPRCVFRLHGCDYADPAGPADASPCGGLMALADLLSRGLIRLPEIKAAWERLLDGFYLRLAEHASLRLLEKPYLYDRLSDELYELNQEGFDWLARCDGTRSGLAAQADPEFLDFLLAESLVAVCTEPRPRPLHLRQSPLPSLRYLELMLTARCNLRCVHCYLGDQGHTDLPLASVLAALQELEAMQGLRALLSGGEALLYPHWEELNARLRDFELRFILLSNGTLLDGDTLSRLQVHEIQISLDGLEAGHELIRGRGTWSRTVANLQAALARGLMVSVATMIHAGNQQELAELGQLLQEWGVREWGLDVPCFTGRLAQHPELYLDPAQAAPYLNLGFGGSDHGKVGDFACGIHHLAVLPTGQVAKCGLFAHRPVGHVQEGLETCWLRLPRLKLSELECAGCPYLTECRGGCRFRAGEGLAPDPVMCALYGIDPKKIKRLTDDQDL